MVDALNAKTLRMNVFLAIATSVVCAIIAKLLSQTTTVIYFPAQKHVPKEPRNFDDVAKQVIAKYSGSDFPNQTYLGKFRELGINTVIIDFPGTHNITQEWRMNVSNFIQRAKTSGFKYSFNIQFISIRNAANLTEDLQYIQNNYLSDVYFNFDNHPFVVFDLSSETGSIRASLRNVSASGTKFFPCAIVDDMGLLRNAYEDGLECFMSSTVTDSYSYSANPTSWDNFKNNCKNRASLFIPAVQNVFKSAEQRRYEDMHPEMDYPNDEPEFTDDISPPPPPPPPEDETEEERIRREEEERRREEEIKREREVRRSHRHRHHDKPKDTRSDFHYAWDYAVKASNIIVVQPQNNTNWILSDKDNFTDTIENLTRSFFQ